MALKEEVISTRFTKQQLSNLKELAEKQGIKPSSLVESITTNFIDVLGKCFKRQDLIIQRDEIKLLYNRFNKNELDDWIEIKYPKTKSCMQLFAPEMKFKEISETWMSWFKLNNHYLYYEDLSGWRIWKCNSDMGYNWLYVNAKIYQKMFESVGCNIMDFKVKQDEFEFKVEIPN